MSSGSREGLIDELRSQNLAVPGEGPLVRIVKFETLNGVKQAIDIQTCGVTKVLSDQEAQQVDG